MISESDPVLTWLLLGKKNPQNQNIEGPHKEASAVGLEVSRHSNLNDRTCLECGGDGPEQ